MQSGNPTFSLHKEIASPKVIHKIHDSNGCTFLSKELPDIDSFNDFHSHFDDDPLSEDFDFKDSIDQSDLTNRDDLLVDPTPEMFTDEQPPDYSFPPRFNVYPDDFLEIEDDVLPSPDNEDKVFNPGILSHEKSVKIITRVTQEKKLAISFASWLFEDFDPPIYELLVFKEVPNSMRLLPFSSENEEKVFKPWIYTFKKFHCCFLSELSHPDSIDQSVLTHCDDLFVDLTPEMFVEEQPPDYSLPPRFDVYPDDFLEIKSDANFDDDSFDSEGEKIKEAELLIDPLDLPCDILSEYDSFNSQEFSRDDVLFSPDNEDKVFNPGILSRDNSVKIITHVTQEKKLAVSFAFWLSKDFDPPFSELFVFKEVPNSMRLLPFSSENEEKVFKPGIYTFKKFHCCFLSELSYL
nr:hypothetical protein [Tanacetum cinerariifolium]